jgi:soluble lytic murein transglycosylase
MAFASLGCTARAYRLAIRAGESAPQRLRFPLPRTAGFLEEAREAGVDPLLAAALIRQESGFDPNAHSAADARGLMQVLPGVGAPLARADGIREWDSALLYQPELNLRFGLRHLAQALRRFPGLEPALAGYNAGTRAAQRWLALPGAKADPEVYIERIQFVETRDYVRRILRNMAVYRALYPGTA